MAGSKRHGRHRRVREAPSARYAAEPAPKELNGVLYDSDVIIEILRGRREIGAAARAMEIAGVPTYTTAISWAEIFAGLKPGEEGVTEAFFRARGEVILDAVVGRRAGGYLAKYGRSKGVQIADALIASAAVNAGLRIWTLNRRHYPMPDLRFFEP